MDRAEALRLLKGREEGIEEWNRRRMEGEEIPGLEGADLSGAYLVDANLTRADLTNANLIGTDLTGANLSEAVFILANINACILSQAVFAGATFGWTSIASNLSEAIGLEQADHWDSSHISIRSLLSFKGDLPENFLRGCGMADEDIAYFRSRIGKRSRFNECFICYSTKDEEFATRLFNDFQGAGIRCWKWNEDAKVGRDLWAEIDTAIRKLDKLVFIMSRSSLTSPPVLDELERALVKEQKLRRLKYAGKLDGDADVLFPVRLDNFVFDKWEHERKVDVTKKVIADARGWKKDHDKYVTVRDRLIEDLKRA